MIKDLPTKPKTIVAIVLTITVLFLVGLAIYGAIGGICTPEEIMCPAPLYNTNV
jgi:hypothetical protein